MMSTPQPAPVLTLAPRVMRGLSFAHALYAVLLGIAMLLVTVTTLSGWSPDHNGMGVIAYLAFFVPIALAFAAYQFRWARRLSRGKVATGAGLLLGAIILFGTGPVSITGALLLFGVVGSVPGVNDTVTPLVSGILVFCSAALGLGTIIALLQPFNYRERAARWIGAIGGALVFGALTELVQTLPALFGSAAAYGIERDLLYLTPALATFGTSVAYAPFGINGSGGELGPIAVVIALTLPVALFLLRGVRSLLAGRSLRPVAALVLGAFVVLASVAPFSGDRLISDPIELIKQSALPGLLLGLSLLAFTIQKRVVVIPLLVVGVAAVLIDLYGWTQAIVPPSDDRVANLINALAARFSPFEILYSLADLIVFAALFALLLHAGVREQNNEEVA